MTTTAPQVSYSALFSTFPPLSLILSVDEGKSLPIPYVYVNSSGSVKNYRPMQVVLACSLEMYAFPFDKQNCSLTFRSWLHSGVFPSVSVSSVNSGKCRVEYCGTHEEYDLSTTT